MAIRLMTPRVPPGPRGVSDDAVMRLLDDRHVHEVDQLILLDAQLLDLDPAAILVENTNLIDEIHAIDGLDDLVEVDLQERAAERPALAATPSLQRMEEAAHLLLDALLDLVGRPAALRRDDLDAQRALDV